MIWKVVKKIYAHLILWTWFSLQFFLFTFTFINIQSNRGLGPYRNVLGFWLAMAKASAAVCNLNSALMIFTMCRVTIEILHSIPLIGDLPWDMAEDFHKISAYSLFLFSTIHVISHYVNIIHLDTSALSLNAGKILFASGVGITGHLLVAALLVIAATSVLKKVRKRCFEVFLICHKACIVVYVLSLCTHGTFCFVKRNTDDHGVKCSVATSWRWIVGPIVILVLEKCFRSFRSLRATEVLRVIAHPSMVLELHIFKPSMKFKPGQYVYLNFPAVSKFQWHPFTITSIPEEGYVGLHIRACGTWTRQVARECGVEFLKDGTIECIQVDALPKALIDGPFGDVCRQVPAYENVVLIGAGIGQTPFAAVLKNLRYSFSINEYGFRKRTSTTRRVFFIGVCRDTYSYEWFHELVHSLEQDNFDGTFTFRFYVTGTLTNQQISNICAYEANFETGKLTVTDPVTLLNSPTYYGRPMWSSLFDEISYECTTNRIGVFYCGPGILGDAIDRICTLKSNKTLKFEYYREKFS